MPSESSSDRLSPSLLFQGFKGDKAKTLRLAAILDGGVPEDATPAGVSAVMETLSELPGKAEQLVFNQWAAAQDIDGARTRWFEALFCWCFAASPSTSSSSSSSSSSSASLSANSNSEQ